MLDEKYEENLIFIEKLDDIEKLRDITRHVIKLNYKGQIDYRDMIFKWKVEREFLYKIIDEPKNKKKINKYNIGKPVSENTTLKLSELIRNL